MLFIYLFFQEQLGYIVFSGVRRSNGTQGLRIIVQSDKHPIYVDERVEAFLASMGVSQHLILCLNLYCYKHEIFFIHVNLFK